MRSSPDLFQVRAEHADDVAHLRLTGRFDAGAVPQLDDAIAQAHPRDVILFESTETEYLLTRAVN